MWISFNDKMYNLDEDKQFKDLIKEMRSYHVPRQLFVHCSQYTTCKLEAFHKKLSDLTPPLPFAISLLDPSKENKQVYEFERIKFAQQMSMEISRLTNGSANEPEISQNKRDMVNKKRIYVPQQQRKIISTSQGRDYIPKSPEQTSQIKVENSFIEVQQYFGSDDNLINLENISSLSTLYNEVFKGYKNPPTLKDIWFSIVGKHAGLVEDKNKKGMVITHIDKEVMQDFIRNYPKVKHGVLLEALPIVLDKSGKVSKVVKYLESCDFPKKYILKYEEYTNNLELNAFSPIFSRITNCLPTEFSYREIYRNSYSHSIKQAICNLVAEEPNINCLENDLDILLSITKTGRKELLSNCQSDIREFISKAKKVYPKSPYFYQGLADILVTSGIDGLALVLKQLNSMKFDLVKNLLNRRENFIQFATQDGLGKLSDLATLDDADKLWWIELVERHKKSGDIVNFSELFTYFYAFRTKLPLGNGGLPNKFPFKHIEELNMPTSSKIIEHIVTNGQNKAQMYVLDGLSLDISEDYFASKEKKFRIITKEMGFKPNTAFPHFSYSLEEQDFSKIMQIPSGIVKEKKLQKSYKLCSNYFYRFIARKDETSPKRFKYENFLSIGNNIDSLNKDLTIKIDSLRIYNDLQQLSNEQGNIGFIVTRDKKGKATSLQFVADESIDFNQQDMDKILMISNDGKTACTFDDLARHINNSDFKSWISKNMLKKSTALSYSAKASLLYITAVAGSGKIASQQAVSPNEELPKFLHALRIFADKFSINSTEDIIKIIHDIGLRADTCPSLGGLTEIINKLYMANPDKIKGLILIKQAFSIVKNYGEDAVVIFTNIAETAKKIKLKSGEKQDQKNVDEEDISDLISNYAKSINQNIQVTEDIKPLIAKVFSLLGDFIEISPSFLINLNSDQQKFLLHKLVTIDIGRSNNILNSKVLNDLIAQVKNINVEKDLYTAVQKYFVQQNLDFKFSSLGSTRSRISLTSSLKSLINLYNGAYYNLRGKIDLGLIALRMLPKGDVAEILIKEGLDEVNSYVEEIASALTTEPIDEHALLHIFDKADARLSYLKDDLVKNEFKWAIDAVKNNVLRLTGSLINASQRPYIEAYFNTFSLAVFMDRAIELSVKNTVQTLISDVFGKEEEDFNNYLIQYISDGGKPIRFGLVASDIDPNSSNPLQIEALKELLHFIDGIVLYQDELYHIQYGEQLKVRKLELDTDERRDAAKRLKNKINPEYQIVGVDGYRVIKLDGAKIKRAVGGKLEESLYRHVRKLSLNQDAIFSFENKYYYLDFIKKNVVEKTHPDLPSLFEINVDNREAVSIEDMQIFKDVIGENKLHDELSLVTNLVDEPALFPSQKVDKYNRKLDKFTDILSKLEVIKSQDQKLFDEYLEILKALSQNITASDLFNVLDLLSNLLGEDGQDVNNLVFAKLNFLYREINKVQAKSSLPISLNALLISLEGLVKSGKFASQQLNDLLENLIPFTLSGAEFPLDIFIKNKDKSQEFLQDLLAVAAELNTTGEKDFFEQLEKIKGRFPATDIEPILSTLLMILVKDVTKIDKYKSIYKKIENISSDNIDKYVSIFQALSSLQNSNFPETIVNFDDITKILDGVESKKYILPKMHEILFKSQPYPAKDDFIKELSKSDADFDKYLDFYDRHPYLQDNRSKMEKNFSTDRVLDVIDGIVRLPNNVPLSQVERVKLVKEFAYVNNISMGKSQIYPRDKDGKPILINGKSSFYLHEYAKNNDVISTENLVELAAKLKDAFQEDELTKHSDEYLSHPDNRRLALQYIAVMRELYYRTTKIIPNSTQIITIINALNNPSRQLQEIETAEGKSVTTALFSALLCAKGCTVLVPTSSKNLVNQDYYGKHNNLFFTSLGFKSKIIDQEKVGCRLDYGAIHYGTSRDIDSLIAEYKILGLSLTTSADNKKYPLACVKDEQDNDLDDLASRTIATEVPDEEYSLSPTWIISTINRFVESKSYRRIEKEGDLEPNDKKQDLRNLIRDLRNEAEANKVNKTEALNQVDTFLPLLEGYLAAACDVHGYLEGIDYQVIEQDLDGKYLDSPVATPMNKLTSEVERGNTFPDARQAFLHDLLNKSGNYPGRKFNVELDPIEIDTKSNKDLSADFEHFIGLSATSGSKKEILEVGMKVSKIPPHKEKSRKILTPRMVKDEEAKHLAIINAVKLNGFENDFCPDFILKILVSAVEIYQKALQTLCYLFGIKCTVKDKQPILIFVNNPIEAENLFHKFDKINNGYKLQFINGKETNDEYKNKIENAGKGNYLTIVVPKDARGIDYDSEHPDGIFGIQAFNSTLRGHIQVLGRLWRKLKPGKFLNIVEGEFRYDSLLQICFGLSQAEKKLQVAYKEEKLNTERAVERDYRQKVDEIIQVVLNQFDKIRLELTKDQADNRQFLLLRAMLLKRMKLIWERCLNDSDKEGKYPNKYVRWSGDELDNEGLNTALENFETQVIDEWGIFKVNELKFLHTSENIKIKRYLAQEIREEFTYNKLERQTACALEQRIQKISKERTSRILEQFVDGDYAVLAFDAEFLSFNNIHNIKKRQAEKQVKSIFKHYALLSLNYEGSSEDILLNLDKILNKIVDYYKTNDENSIKLYPIINEVLLIYDNVSESIKTDEDNKKLRKRQENVNFLRDKSAQKALEQQVVAYLKLHLGSIFNCLRLLGLKVVWFEDTYVSLLKLLSKKSVNIFDLYRELYRLKSLLENNPSIFPFASYLFGTSDLKNLINQAIAYIDYLSDNNEDNARFLNEACEEGQCAGIFEAFLPQKELDMIRKRIPSDKLEKWDKLISCFDKVKEEQKGFSAVEELLVIFRSEKNSYLHNYIVNFLSSSISNVINFSQYNIDPKVTIISKLNKMRDKILQDNPGIYFTQEKLYIEKKQASLKKKIEDSLDLEYGKKKIHIEDLAILNGYEGNSQTFELRINYKGDISESKTLGVNEENTIFLKGNNNRQEILKNLDADKNKKENEKKYMQVLLDEKKRSLEDLQLSLENQSDSNVVEPGETLVESWVKFFQHIVCDVEKFLEPFLQIKKNKIDELNKSIDESEDTIKRLETEITSLEKEMEILREEMARHNHFSGVLVKKFSSLEDLLKFEIRCLAQNDPRSKILTTHEPVPKL